MDIKKILLISLIVVAIVTSVSAVSAGWFDGLFGGEEAHDNVIEIGGITFNTTNVTKFELLNKTESDEGYWEFYMDQNKTGYSVNIHNASKYFSESEESDWGYMVSQYKEVYNNVPCQTINGVVVYTMTSNTGDHVGEPRYASYIENRDLKTIVTFSSPNPNETVKMASTLKFK